MVILKQEGENWVQSSKILLLRYSDFQGYDTIKEHKTVIASYGYCWFGKFGRIISSKYLTQFLMGRAPYIVFLYTAGVLYKCHMDTMTYERPSTGYPKYYDSFLFKNEDFTPKVFLKLTSIDSISIDALEQYVVVSSGKPILYDLKKTTSSFILIQDKDDWTHPVKKERVEKEKTLAQKKPRNLNSCVYQKNSLCTNRCCINYSYECDRPSHCIKQEVE